MMDWFHSSQFRQLGENSSNMRKGYKVCSMDSDLDKSETPLLCETDKKKVPSVLPEKAKSPSHIENVCTETFTSKKSPQGFANLHQASTSEKDSSSNKTKTEPRSIRMSYRQEGKSQESEKLLIDFGNFEGKDEEDDDDM